MSDSRHRNVLLPIQRSVEIPSRFKPANVVGGNSPSQLLREVRSSSKISSAPTGTTSNCPEASLTKKDCSDVPVTSVSHRAFFPDPTSSSTADEYNTQGRP